MPIFTETLGKIKAALSFNAVMRETESLNGLQGKLFIKAWEGGNLVYSYESKNVIVNSASVLIARLLKDSSEPDAGISYFAVGTGGQGWDLQNPPAPSVTQLTLESELARKAISSVNTTFVDPATGDPTTVATNVVDFAATFSESEAVGPLVEMSLFGGDATAALNSGTMLNYRTFPVLNKTAAMTFSVIFRITC
jgi:hypothetical protein